MADFRAAVDANTPHISDAPGDVQPAIFPAMQPFDKPFVPHRCERCTDQRKADLPAVSMSAEQQIPFKRLNVRFGIRIVREHNFGCGMASGDNCAKAFGGLISLAHQSDNPIKNNWLSLTILELCAFSNTVIPALLSTFLTGSGVAYPPRRIAHLPPS